MCHFNHFVPSLLIPSLLFLFSSLCTLPFFSSFYHFFFCLFYLGALELTLESVFSLYFLQNSVSSLTLNSMILFYIVISIWNSSCCYFCGSSETSSHHIAQTELKLAILLSQPPEYWEIRRAPPFLDNVEFVLGWYGDLKENVPRREGLY